MLNQVTLVGRITADPELKTSTTGRPFCFITVAAMRSFKNQETNEYETDFIDVSLWGMTAENVVKHCGKGSAVAVRGRLANRVLDFPGEQTFRTISVVGERVSFIQLKAPDSGINNALKDLEQSVSDDLPGEHTDIEQADTEQADEEDADIENTDNH